MSFKKNFYLIGVVLSMVLYGVVAVAYAWRSDVGAARSDIALSVRWILCILGLLLIGTHAFFLRRALLRPPDVNIALPAAGESSDEARKRAKNEVFAKISHEIRTPLNGIIGMTEVALTTRLDDNQRRIISIIGSESNHLLELINGVLDFSKIEAGKLTIEASIFNLNRLLEALGETVAVQAARKGLEFNLYQPPDMPHRVIGDQTRLRQVLLNLASNAVKFTSEGEISIKAELISRQPERATIRFTVQDTGIGIADEKQSTIFDSFTQADETTTRLYGGTGLGTTISRSLVEIMGGQLQLESRPGQGTRIWFELDFEPGPDEVRPEAEAAQAVQPKYVLMVDDCFTSRQFALKYLHALGCRTQAAEDGAQALNMLKEASRRQDPFDLIITDFRMPRISGYELARQAREMETYQDTPIIAVTGLQEIAGGEDFRSMGFDRCLAKPLIFDDLKSAITEVCTPQSRKEQRCPSKKHGTDAAVRQPARILLAEDYPANQQVVTMHLQSVGYRVDLAENGQSAVRMAARTSYDLILMDLDMPIMDGYTATRTIRLIEQQGKAGPETPIIALTAHAMPAHEKRSRKAGANDFLTKPVRRRRLLETVQQWLAKHERDTGPDPVSANAPASIHEPDRSAPPIDWPLALEEFMGRKDRLNRVLDDFQHHIREQLNTIEQAISDGDAGTVKRQAHAMKGGAANLIAIPLSEAAARLEQLADVGDLTGAPGALNALQREAVRLRACTRSHSIQKTT